MADLRVSDPMPEVVASSFLAFPEPQRGQLLLVRRLIFAVAATTPGVGALTETLRWGEPAYVTEASRSGSTIRLGVPRSEPDRVAILFNCRTTLVESFRAICPDLVSFLGSRAILIPASDPLPEAALAICLARALTYHQRRRRSVMSS